MTPGRGRRAFATRRGQLALEYAVRRHSPGISNDAHRLLREGYLLIPDFIDPGQVEALSDSLPRVEDCEPSPEGTMTRTWYQADKIGGLAPFFLSPWLGALMREVLGPAGHRLRSAVQYRDFLGDTGAFELFFHLDTWLPRFKAFLYLTDVDAGGGPLRYVPRSNFGAWRLRTEAQVYRLYPNVEEYVSNPDAAFVGCSWPHEVRTVAHKLGTEPLSLTGKRGTLVVFDARGLHATTALTEPRTILYSYWTKRGLHT